MVMLVILPTMVALALVVAAVAHIRRSREKQGERSTGVGRNSILETRDKKEEIVITPIVLGLAMYRDSAWRPF